MNYVCLLRGINVGGKNRVDMAVLRQITEAAGYHNVSTYINSGNLFFNSSSNDVLAHMQTLEAAIARYLALQLRVVVVSANDVAAALADAPATWGTTDTARKHNLLFVRPPTTAAEVMAAIGVTDPAIEVATEGRGVVYWSASLEQFGRTASSKFAAKPIYQDVTVRNYNTVQEILRRLQV